MTTPSSSVAAPQSSGIPVYGSSDVRARLLEDLGFTTPKGIDAAIGDKFGGTLSDERLDLLDVDALIWLIETDKQKREVNSKPVYKDLPVAKTAIFSTPEDDFYNGASALTVLSIPSVLDDIVPKLAAAVK